MHCMLLHLIVKYIDFNCTYYMMHVQKFVRGYFVFDEFLAATLQQQ